MDSFTRSDPGGTWTFDVREWGDTAGAAGGDPETAVLLHGFPQTSDSWRLVAPLLAAGGLRVLAPDQRGYSPRARPRGRRPYRVQELAADVVALIEAADARPVHLVGHDWGAVVAWALALHRPDLVATVTAVSVPHPRAFLDSMTRSPQLLRSWYMGLFQLPWVPEALATRTPAAFDGLLRRAGMDAAQLRRMRSQVIDSGALPGALGWYRALPFGRLAAAHEPVRVPAAMVWGEGDIALDRRGAELTARYVAAPYALHVVPDGGHWLPETQPELLARIVLDQAAEHPAR